MIAACLKWVDRRPEIDPLTGSAADDDARFGGCSAADEAALEWALRIADAREDSVVAVTAGHGPADAALRLALAAGVTRAVRVDMDPAAPSDAVATAIAGVIADADVVCCGDHSFDRGSGAMPAFLAHELGLAQALGLIEVAVGDDELSVTRRLDGARRELLSLRGPAVISVEGATARLRRASLAATVRASSMPVEVRQGPTIAPAITTFVPYRPRARSLTPPSGASALARVLSITDALSDREPPQLLVLDPPDAADRILDALRQWAEPVDG
jgi:electron transfer flavoprotein beta subunit